MEEMKVIMHLFGVSVRDVMLLGMNTICRVPWFAALPAGEVIMNTFKVGYLSEITKCAERA